MCFSTALQTALDQEKALERRRKIRNYPDGTLGGGGASAPNLTTAIPTKLQEWKQGFYSQNPDLEDCTNDYVGVSSLWVTCCPHPGLYHI